MPSLGSRAAESVARTIYAIAFDVCRSIRCVQSLVLVKGTAIVDSQLVREAKVPALTRHAIYIKASVTKLTAALAFVRLVVSLMLMTVSSSASVADCTKHVSRGPRNREMRTCVDQNDSLIVHHDACEVR